MKESFYFPHDNDARNDDRILELRSCYGNEWYALFFYTLETMSQSEDWSINRVAIGGLSLGYSVDRGMLENFYAKCLELWLFYEEDWKIFSERMVAHKNSRRELSEAWKRGALKRWKNSHPISPPIAPPIAGKERKGNKDSTIVKHTGDFEKFWNLYGKKIDKTKCEKVFSRLSTHDIELIFKKLPAYIASTPKIEYRKNPLTWLHWRNWEDEQNPGSIKFFWLLDWYDEEIVKTVTSKVTEKSSEQEVRLHLNKAIIDVESKRMTDEQKEKVRSREKTWRADNGKAEYEETPYYILARIINDVKLW